jgi:hypothetical protein
MTAPMDIFTGASMAQTGAEQVCADIESAYSKKHGASALAPLLLRCRRSIGATPCFFLPARFRPMARNSFRT